MALPEAPVVVITGASSGIGRAAASLFAERGARLVLAARAEATLQEAADECRGRAAAGGGEVDVLVVPTDITNADQRHALIDRTIERFGRIDVWVNNASVMVYGRFVDIPGDVHQKVMETNLLAPIDACRAVLPIMIEQGSGVVVNVSSLYGRMTTPYVSAYATSKYGMRGFTQILRRELQEVPGVHACAVMPSSIDTPIFKQAANYLGRPTRPIPPTSSVEKAAEAVVACAEHPTRNKERVVGRMGHFFAIGAMLLPPVYDVLVGPAMRIAGMGRGRVEQGPGNVFEPQPDLEARTGGWR